MGPDEVRRTYLAHFSHGFVVLAEQADGEAFGVLAARMQHEPPLLHLCDAFVARSQRRKGVLRAMIALTLPSRLGSLPCVRMPGTRPAPATRPAFARAAASCHVSRGAQGALVATRTRPSGSESDLRPRPAESSLSAQSEKVRSSILARGPWIPPNPPFDNAATTLLPHVAL